MKKYRKTSNTPPPILSLHERALDAIAFERQRGCKLYYWHTPDSYVWEWPDGSLHLMTIMAPDLYPEIGAIRQILHDTGARPPEGWLPRRERNALQKMEH